MAGQVLDRRGAARQGFVTNGEAQLAGSTPARWFGSARGLGRGLAWRSRVRLGYARHVLARQGAAWVVGNAPI